MTRSFDLLTKRWIPSLRLDGKPDKLGLREVLCQAHQLLEVRDASPLVTVALHRLLLAVLHRAYDGPRSPEHGAELWNSGAFDPQVIDAYFKRATCEGRFDLFDLDRPFYQHPAAREYLADEGPSSDSGNPTSQIVHEWAGGNNAMLFDHTGDASCPGLGLDEAARYVVAYQCFAPGGTLTRKKGEPTSTTAAPLVAAAVVLPRGNNLFQTLVLNMVHYSPDDDEPWANQTRDDAPAWELDLPDAIPRRPLGYLDYLTWQSRRILLLPPGEPEPSLVRRAVAVRGLEFPKGYFPRDPMMSHQRNTKAPRDQNPWPARRLEEGKATWRDSAALFQDVPEESRCPRVCSWIADLGGAGASDLGDRCALSVYGLGSSRAKIDFWRHETLPLPLAYLNDKYLVGSLASAVAVAEGVANVLRASCWYLATKLLAPQEDRNPDRDAVQRMVDSFAYERRYWSRLETPFRKFLMALPGDPDHQGAELNDWVDRSCRTARNVFKRIASDLDQSGRSLRATAFAARMLSGRLKKIMEPYKENSDEPVTAAEA